MATLPSLTDDLDHELGSMFEEILGITGTGNHGQMGASSNLFPCAKCNQAFTNKRSLNAHAKSCK